MNDNRNAKDKKHEARSRLIMKLFPYLRKNGLQSVRMEEIAKVMEISRATLYKYFSTKEDIIGFIISGFVEYMDELSASRPDSETSFGTRFQQYFEQSVSLMEYFTEIFLNELEISYPEWYERLNEAMQRREKQVLAFYDEGIRKGLFNRINGKILIKQDDILRSMLTVKYLMTNQLTVQQVLTDYYQLKKIQLFQPDKLSVVDDTAMTAVIEHLTQKITKNLY